MINVIVPLEQEGTEAVVSNWLHVQGDRIALNDPLVELETDKVSVEVPSPAEGILEEILLKAGAQAHPGEILARIRPLEKVSATPERTAPATLSEQPSAERDISRWQSPAVRKALAETGLDPETLTGTGRDGRLTRADVDRAARNPTRKTEPRTDPKADHPPSAGPSRIVPHDQMRLAIARNMVKSVTDAPQVTAVFEADFSAVMAHREKQKPAFDAEGISLSYTAYLLAAAATAMRAMPQVNSRWHADRLEIFRNVNIGVGTSLGEKGLIVPVIRSVQDLSLRGIAVALQDITRRAREGKLTTEDTRGGTFTLSNHGVSGSLFATPVIINQPQSAILGVGKLEKRVVIREVGGVDTIQIRPMAYVSLTIDHRVLDGHQTNAWLSAFVDALENWDR